MDIDGGLTWAADEPAAVAEWRQLVNEHAARVWRGAVQSTRNATRALEVSQLVWLRLELTARSGGFPPDLDRWLMQQVHECTGRRSDERAGGDPCGSNGMQTEGVHSEA
jgi:hypothetical protein